MVYSCACGLKVFGCYATQKWSKTGGPGRPSGHARPKPMVRALGDPLSYRHENAKQASACYMEVNRK